jgi:CRP/FNR family transcriptional regulator
MQRKTPSGQDSRVEQALRIPGRAGRLPEALLADARLVRLERGQFAFRSGDHCRAYLVLLTGTVRVQLISDEGREVSLYRVGPGNSCILTTSCLMSQEDYPAEAIAETDVEAVAVSRATFREALDNDPEFRSYIFDGFSQRLASVIKRIAELTFASIDARLARVLVRLHREGKRNVTHHELGIELGTAREVVSRHLKRFEKNGWVQLGRGSIIANDIEQLQRLGQDS